MIHKKLDKIVVLLLALTMVWPVGPAFAEEPSSSEKAQTIKEDIYKPSGGWLDELLGRLINVNIGGDNRSLRWEDGLVYSGPSLTMFWSAWLMYDVAMMVPSRKVKRAHPSADSFKGRLRRFRAFVDGSFLDLFEFRFMYDVSGQSGEQVEAWIGIKGRSQGRSLRIGYLKAPFSLEQLTSSRHITFMERSVALALAPLRDWGIRAQTPLADERMTISVGIFTDEDKFSDAYNDWSSVDVTARVTGLPVYEHDGSRLLHLGFSLSLKNVRDQTISITSRPEVGVTDERLMQTGDFEADSGLIMGLEAAWVNGPLSLQGELIRTWVKGGSSPIAFTGFYAYVSYFITGEHRPYQMRSGSFGKLLPNDNFDVATQHWGAVEVAARVSHLDLTDGDVEGGAEWSFTLGVNWHLDRYMRIMVNLTHSMVADQPDLDYHPSSLTTLQARLQLAF